MLLLFFFFKQKTAYELRISDWSSDVCSSDLAPQFAQFIKFEIALNRRIRLLWELYSQHFRACYREIPCVADRRSRCDRVPFLKTSFARTNLTIPQCEWRAVVDAIWWPVHIFLRKCGDQRCSRPLNVQLDDQRWL